tara:strand:+ start:647 stop:1144 length:498 start_codon:yes stop_codon:yes gene_type:complete
MDALTEQNLAIDAVENMMLNSDNLIEFPVKHSFTPGIYSREIFMPKDSMLTSKIHKTEHPYIVLTGVAVVHIPEGGVEVLAAGHSGITKPGTRRVLYIKADCRWVTFHALSAEEEQARVDGATDDELVDLIEGRILERKELPDGRTMFELYKQKIAVQKLEGGQS